MRKTFFFALASAILMNGFAASEATRAIDTDFADPCVIETNGGYYAFGTAGNGKNVQVAASDDFSTWTRFKYTDAMPGPFPSWIASTPNIWAPDVIQLDNGTFVMYFSAASSEDSSKHCIGAATSSVVTGPYTPLNSPIACPIKKGGAIDANGFNDGGTYYVVYKIDGNSLNGDGTEHDTPIMLQKLKSDGVTPNGDATVILEHGTSDGPLIEAPSLAHADGNYYLSFSSNMYDTTLYDISYATADVITGPYTKAQTPDGPLLVTGDPSNVGDLSGPGGADFTSDGTRIVFHAFKNGKDISDGRAMYVASIYPSGGVITIL
ncbi:hypothetical protein N7495_005318 [Penicillium taxi]|uniref:uncharacterized protein n=1 Tax=Penicillium taxi TaxID=168475 RepID=UPI0025451F15|nr:uncharacterized protein N7495_005318 [Penicillium taxi]KAJ5893627.1 hypothetical protein N7495_005318 [Penicillium taxi]